MVVLLPIYLEAVLIALLPFFFYGNIPSSLFPFARFQQRPGWARPSYVAGQQAAAGEDGVLACGHVARWRPSTIKARRGASATAGGWHRGGVHAEY